MRAAVVGLLLLVSLAACGGGSDEPSPAATSATPGAGSGRATSTSPAATTPSGTPAPEALMRFRCEKSPSGPWNASGYLVNGGKTKVTYQVTVFVGDASGVAQQARTKEVSSVAAGGSVGFHVRRIPSPDEGGTCHVQVLATG